MSLANAVQSNLGLTLDQLSRLSSDQVQLQLADPLRKLAINYLLTSPSDLALSFRAANPDYMNILKGLARDKEWATDDMARALAEIFGFNLDITVTQQNEPGSAEKVIMPRYVSYTHPVVRTDKTIHLYNSQSKGMHWYVGNYYYNTKPDGNCLLNAIAQSLQLFALEEVNPAQAQQIKNATDIEVIMSQLKYEGFEGADAELKKRATQVLKELSQNVANPDERKNFEQALYVAKEEMYAVKSPGTLSKFYSRPEVDSSSNSVSKKRPFSKV